MTSREIRLSPAAWAALALFALALAWDASGLDLPLARLAGSARGFPWRDHWLLSGVLHEGGRVAAWLLALALCLSVWWPLGPMARTGLPERLQLAVSALLGALAVSLLKAGSDTSCPWELSDFGGLVPYASHWSLRPDGGSGHCFPAGHASAGFSFVGGYFAFRRADPRLARLWLAAAASAGLVFGLAQQWRGAHFMSHTLWSGALCWSVAHAVHAAWPRAWSAEGI
jgi:membrane-associated PAP2 superfamily phosphatase